MKKRLGDILGARKQPPIQFVGTLAKLKKENERQQALQERKSRASDDEGVARSEQWELEQLDPKF